MVVYDVETRNPVESPDLSNGYLVDGTIVTGYTTEIMPGTVTDSRPGGIKRLMPVYEECQWYYPNPKTSSESSEKTIDEKISDAVTVAVALAQGGL